MARGRLLEPFQYRVGIQSLILEQVSNCLEARLDDV